MSANLMPLGPLPDDELSPLADFQGQIARLSRLLSDRLSGADRIVSTEQPGS
jgi:hypothetical protein